MNILAKNKDVNNKQHIFTIELDTSEENRDSIDDIVYIIPGVLYYFSLPPA